jgi:hypothetical protein
MTYPDINGMLPSGADVPELCGSGTTVLALFRPSLLILYFDFCEYSGLQVCIVLGLLLLASFFSCVSVGSAKNVSELVI